MDQKVSLFSTHWVVTLSQIRQNLKFIRDNLKLLYTLLTVLKTSAPKSILSKTSNSSLSKFRDTMTDFHESASKSYEKLDTRFTKAIELYEAAVIHFGEEPKISPDEFFGIFAQFVSSYNMAKAENEAAVLKEEELKRREAAIQVFYVLNLSQERQNQRSRQKSGIAALTSNDGDQGGLDDLISSIRSGKAFKGPRSASTARRTNIKNKASC